MKQFNWIQMIRAVLILLLCSVLLGGCHQKQQFEFGDFSYKHRYEPVMMGLKSSTDTFPIDDVSLDFYFGLFPVHDRTPKNYYAKSHIENGNGEVFFAVYINANADDSIVPEATYQDYSKLENYYFLKEISEEDAFSEAYSFSMDFWSGVTYQHHESITIPKAVFSEGMMTEKRGEFEIVMIAWQPIKEDGTYYLSYRREMRVLYSVSDQGNIKLFDLK